MSKSFAPGPLSALGSAGLLVLAALCAPAAQKVKVYDVPKEKTSNQVSAEGSNPRGGGVSDPHAGIPMAMPKLKWAKLPDGWKENPSPGSMRAASFLVVEGDNEAEVAAIPMGGMAGVESQLVNMWRGQLKLSPLSDGEIVKESGEVSVGDSKARFFDMASTESVIGGKYKARILVAMLKKPGTTWFFKFAGEDGLVAKHKDEFVEFLQGVSFEAAQMPAGHPPTSAGGGMGMGKPPMMGGGMSGGDMVKAGTGDHPEWQVPATWTELDHSSFLVAKFRASGDAGAQADINVSMSGGSGGGLLMNVNRWRGQLSLGQLDQAGLDKITTSIEVPSGEAKLVDMSGAGAENGDKLRCVGVIVTLGTETWFYKLMGSETVVTREKDALLKFVRSVKYNHAP